MKFVDLFILILVASPVHGKRKGSKAKSSKGSKASKGGKSEGRVPTSSKSDDDGINLEKRFGRLLTNKEASKIYRRKAVTYVTSVGLVNFMTPGNSIAMVDYWHNWGVELTQEEATRICLTKCNNNEACKAVHTRMFEPDFPGLKLQHICTMFNPKLGEDTVFQYPNPGHDFEMDIFTKKLAEMEIPEYKGCDITHGSDGSDLVTAIGCLKCLSKPSGAEDKACTTICPSLLTDDFLAYIAPAVSCVAQEGNDDAVVSCLGCLMGSNTLANDQNEIAASICITDPEYSVLRGNCGSVCFENIDIGLNLTKCEASLQSALLCDAGSNPEVRFDGKLYGGAINHPYKCPDEVAM